MTLWLVVPHRPKAGKFRCTWRQRVNLDLEPCRTVMAGGGFVSTEYWLEEDGKLTGAPEFAKPPYRVPSMVDIAAVPWNGFTVASTFSGGGGSCTGYRMAGFRVAWANEFVPVAQESYRANAASGSVLDGRDIHAVQPSDILRAASLAPGELDLLDGSPPCQAFSSAGTRERGWGKGKRYEHGAVQCNETLFSEYIRLLRGLMPKVFVAENVSGLIKGTAKGFFLEILAALKASGYRVEARLLDAQWLGVPQARQRLIFVGVRNDLGLAPAFPRPLPYRYSVRDALPWIKAVGPIRATGFQGGGGMTPAEAPSPTVMAGGGGGMNTSQFGVKAEVGAGIDALSCRMIVGNDAFKPKWGTTARPSPTISASRPGRTGGAFEIARQGGVERRKFSIAELRRICGFPDDFRLCGSFAQQWSVLGNSVPPVMACAIATAIRDNILFPLRQRGTIDGDAIKETVRRRALLG